MWYDQLIFYYIIFVLIFEINGGGLYASNYPYDGLVSNILLSKEQSNANADSDGRKISYDQENDHSKFQSSGEDFSKYFKKDKVLNEQNAVDVQKGSTASVDRHIIGQDLEADKSHNRKHTKSGFHNTYNKDESGSNSSYFEDSDDRGGNSSYDKRYGSQSDDADRKYNEGFLTDKSKNSGDDRSKVYSSAAGNSKQYGLERDNGDSRRFSNGYSNQYQNVPTYSEPRKYRPIERVYDYDQPSIYRNQEIDVRPLYSSSDYNNNNDYLYRSHGNDLAPIPPIRRSSTRLTLPRQPPSILSSNHRRQDDSDNFFQRKITIYEDPRDIHDSQQQEQRRFGQRPPSLHPYNSNSRDIDLSEESHIYHSSPRLDYRPPSTTHINDYYYKQQRRNDDWNRDNSKYRDY